MEAGPVRSKETCISYNWSGGACVQWNPTGEKYELIDQRNAGNADGAPKRKLGDVRRFGGRA